MSYFNNLIDDFRNESNQQFLSAAENKIKE